MIWNILEHLKEFLIELGKGFSLVGNQVRLTLEEDHFYPELGNDNAVVTKFATVQKEGTRNVTRNVEYYNLDMILSIGYRVKSDKGIIFRKWATKVLEE